MNSQPRQADMEQWSWCSPTWDMMGHGASDSYLQTPSDIDPAGQSSSKPLQHAGDINTDSQALPEAFTTSLQNMHDIPHGDEMTPLRVVQYVPEWASNMAQQPKETSPRLIPSECSQWYHSHSQRKSPNTRASKEDDEAPQVRHCPASTKAPSLTHHHSAEENKTENPKEHSASDGKTTFGT